MINSDLVSAGQTTTARGPFELTADPAGAVQAGGSKAGGSSAEWFAVFTLPQNEKHAARQLELRGVETFLPTYETVRVWKNRQRVRTILPLFPTYLFVHIHGSQRRRVLESPGVVHIVGNSKLHTPVPEAEIEWLRMGVRAGALEPFHELAAGKRVRIRMGAMEGVEGVLVRKSNGMKFVLSVPLINQHAALEVSGEELELLPD